jgi:tetrahydromethanopterin S-methyltransferase subunit G
MKTLEEIVAAAKHLKPADFMQLRKRLDRVEQKLWAAELSAATGQCGRGDRRSAN